MGKRNSPDKARNLLSVSGVAYFCGSEGEGFGAARVTPGNNFNERRLFSASYLEKWSRPGSESGIVVEFSLLDGLVHEFFRDRSVPFHSKNHFLTLDQLSADNLDLILERFPVDFFSEDVREFDKEEFGRSSIIMQSRYPATFLDSTREADTVFTKAKRNAIDISRRKEYVDVSLPSADEVELDKSSSAYLTIVGKRRDMPFDSRVPIRRLVNLGLREGTYERPISKADILKFRDRYFDSSSEKIDSSLLDELSLRRRRSSMLTKRRSILSARMVYDVDLSQFETYLASLSN